MTMTTTEDAWIMAINCQAVTDEGLALKDAPAFLETATGQIFMKDTQKFKLFKMKAGVLTWIPYGWLASPILSPAAEEGIQTGMGSVLNVFNSEIARKFKAWVSTAKFINEACEEKSGKAMWKSRVALWHKFEEKVNRN